jgi:hypothetical protein
MKTLLTEMMKWGKSRESSPSRGYVEDEVIDLTLNRLIEKR